MSAEECNCILKEKTSGVLSLYDEKGYTYGVPLNYIREGNRIYFHSATVGHKIEAAKFHDKVCFTVIAEDTVLPERTSTKYRSVIVFGRIRMAESDEEKTAVLSAMGKRFSPDRTEHLKNVISKKLNVTEVMVLEIEHITGKKAIEFLQDNNREE
ncbi:MAG: pyridoxamine 5'-phosphate oxidase family protein [Bacillota bacterium]|nr:pyridoxamine 5'-phosphate oxidase family protein [Bacillota bacterium]